MAFLSSEIHLVMCPRYFSTTGEVSAPPANSISQSKEISLNSHGHQSG